MLNTDIKTINCRLSNELEGLNLSNVFIENLNEFLNPLPEALTELNINDCNTLTKLPKLPPCLYKFTCKKCGITEIPKLPSTVQLNDTMFTYNNITYIGDSFINVVNPDKYISGMIFDRPLYAFRSSSPLHSMQFSSTHKPTFQNQLLILVVKYSLCGNPVHNQIKTQLNDNIMDYLIWERKTYKRFVVKIEEWWLECKYSPKYKYCREKTVMKDYNELYNN